MKRNKSASQDPQVLRMSSAPGGVPVWHIRLTALGAAMVTVGVTGLLMMSPLGPRVAIPGPLRSFHAALKEDCGKCHEASAVAVHSLLHGMVPTELGLVQSRKCLACHNLGSYPLLPHGWSPDERAEVRDLIDETSNETPFPLSIGTTVHAGSGGSLECSTCHREHHGRSAPLAELSNQQCQACHSSQFRGFGDGHPEFDAFPYVQRTGIAFDHPRHLNQHFSGRVEEQGSQRCLKCHGAVPDEDQMFSRDFESACGSCHEDEVFGGSQVEGKGLAFLSLPSIDLDSLSDSGVMLGHWPSDSALGDTPMTPFLELLLRGRPGLEDDLSILDELDLLDLSGTSDEQRAAVGRVVLGIKRLLLDLQTGGHAALRSRIEVALGHSCSDDLAASLLGQLPGEVLGTALGRWLPGLEAELQGGAGPASISSQPDEDLEGILAADYSREAWMEWGGWYLQDLDFSIRYRPVGHADQFIRAWLDLTGESVSPDDDARSIFADLSRPGAVGVCTKCHTTDRQADGSSQINWALRSASLEMHGVTSFSHAVHFPVIGERKCLTCHDLEQTDDSEPTSTSSFRPMTIATCTQCHGPEQASVRCLSCHNYHARGPEGLSNDTLLEQTLSGGAR